MLTDSVEVYSYLSRGQQKTKGPGIPRQTHLANALVEVLLDLGFLLEKTYSRTEELQSSGSIEELQGSGSIEELQSSG